MGTLCRKVRLALTALFSEAFCFASLCDFFANFGKMVASIVRTQRGCAEDIVSYCRGRNRNASALCRSMGSPADSKSSFVSAVLLDDRGKKWLQSRRVSFLGRFSSEGSNLASRTDTRSSRGEPCTRRHDAIDYAKRVRVDTPPDLHNL